MLDPASMERMLKQLGIKARRIDADEVIIKGSAGDLLLKGVDVVEMNMQGKKVFQISASHIEELSYNSDDIELVSQEAHISRELAEDFLKKAKGDVAEAILLAQEAQQETQSQAEVEEGRPCEDEKSGQEQ